MSEDPTVGGYILDCFDEEEEEYYDTTEYLTIEDVDYLRNKTLDIAKETESRFRRIIDPTTNQSIKAKVKINLSLYGRTGSVDDLGSGEPISYGNWPLKDSWISSDNSAKKKAFTAFSFSSNENAFTTRSLVNWFPYLDHSFTMEPGGLPLYKNKKLIGGIGISGDSSDINEKIALTVSKMYSPPDHIKIDSENVRFNISTDTGSKKIPDLNPSEVTYFSETKKKNLDEKKFTISIKSRSSENSDKITGRQYFFIKKFPSGKETRFCPHTFTKETIDSLKKKSGVLICPTCAVLKK